MCRHPVLRSALRAFAYRTDENRIRIGRHRTASQKLLKFLVAVQISRSGTAPGRVVFQETDTGVARTTQHSTKPAGAVVVVAMPAAHSAWAFTSAHCAPAALRSEPRVHLDRRQPMARAAFVCAIVRPLFGDEPVAVLRIVRATTRRDALFVFLVVLSPSGLQALSVGGRIRPDLVRVGRAPSALVLVSVSHTNSVARRKQAAWIFNNYFL